jgi:spermidine synthase
MFGMNAADDQHRSGLTLFLVGFLVLFFELSCIRWFSARVVFLQFFTNIVLIACFLGMSCGCLAARQKRNWLALFPLIALGAFAAARLTVAIYNYWGGLVIDLGHQASPQEVFFGAEYRDPDLAQFVIPIDLIAAAFFLLIAFAFVGLGQVLGRTFDAFPNRVLGYSFNIGGSLAGIVLFSAISLLQMPPYVWIAITSAGVAYLLYLEGNLSRVHLVTLVVLVVCAGLPLELSNRLETRWSPYYAVDHDKAAAFITVNNIGHQSMVNYDLAGSSYSLIHLLERHSAGKPFSDALIIGAGSGNDVTHALRFGVQSIDAVEIDPVIQDIGIRYHPNHPYQDNRVARHLDDGRHFLRTTDRKYDLVVYALVDSLILHSGYANIRLESYLFTEQAFQDIRRVLKPDGVFVMYNYYRQGWIVQRVAAMAKQVFGCDPVVLPLPHTDVIRSSDQTGFTTIVAGCNQAIPAAFGQYGTFWLNTKPAENLAVDGFHLKADALPGGKWEPIAPAKMVVDNNAPSQFTSDDWPFLYVSGRLIPDLTVRSMILLGALGIAMVWWFTPQKKLQLNSRMFFLGAAFMLLETKAVVQMALLFGSTWIVNSAVFFTALTLILLANLYVIKVPSLRLSRHYLALLALLAITVLVPFEVFLSGNMLWRYVVPCLLALGPMFFAGIVFARSFRDEPNPDIAFGSNIAGSVIGGLAESFSMLLGFQHLLIIAICLYLLSVWKPSMRIRLSPAT